MSRFKNRLEQNGNPTEEFLNKIAIWNSSFIELMIQIKKYWKYADSNEHWQQNNEYYTISTGGWKGNESIIEHLQKNDLFWNLCWYSTRKGGHYVFEIK